MKHLPVLLAFLLVPTTVWAAEKVSGTNFMMTETSNWQTGEDSGYWMFHSEGISQPDVGQFEVGPVECHGSGYWDKESSWGEGICIHGVGDDTRTSSWKMEKGQTSGEWTFLGGTGKYEGITGQGTYTPTQLPEGRNMSAWQGELAMPE